MCIYFMCFSSFKIGTVLNIIFTVNANSWLQYEHRLRALSNNQVFMREFAKHTDDFPEQNVSVCIVM